VVSELAVAYRRQLLHYQVGSEKTRQERFVRWGELRMIPIDSFNNFIISGPFYIWLFSAHPVFALFQKH